jgi:hypothetical protein
MEASYKPNHNLKYTCIGRSPFINLEESKTLAPKLSNDESIKNMLKRKTKTIFSTKARHTTLLPKRMSEGSITEDYNRENNLDANCSEENDVLRRLSKREKIVTMFNTVCQ